MAKKRTKKTTKKTTKKASTKKSSTVPSSSKIGKASKFSSKVGKVRDSIYDDVFKDMNKLKPGKGFCIYDEENKNTTSTQMVNRLTLACTKAAKNGKLNKPLKGHHFGKFQHEDNRGVIIQLVKTPVRKKKTSKKKSK